MKILCIILAIENASGFFTPENIYIIGGLLVFIVGGFLFAPKEIESQHVKISEPMYFSGKNETDVTFYLKDVSGLPWIYKHHTLKGNWTHIKHIKVYYKRRRKDKPKIMGVKACGF